MIEFCNDYNLPNLAEENSCYRIPQNQIYVDLLKISKPNYTKADFCAT